MTTSTVTLLHSPAESSSDALTEVLRTGARALLQAAIEAEVSDVLAAHEAQVDDQGRRRFVRHGDLPARPILTGIGPVPVRVPKVRDRGTAANGPGRIRFASSIVPPDLRQAKSVENLLPVLSLRGLSTGDVKDALARRLGPDAPGLSPGVIARLKRSWEQESDAWRRQDLSGRRFLYIWVDGISLRPRLESDPPGILVVIGADADGRKEILGIQDGFRENADSWRDLLRDLKDRGLPAPGLAIGDGALGFWTAVRDVFPETREQRCWVHKTAHVTGALPTSLQDKAKRDLQDIWMAETRVDAEAAFERFVTSYSLKYGKAVTKLTKDKAELFTVYDFPAEHWRQIRTTNPVESVFATVRNRTRKTRGCLSRRTALVMVFKLVLSARKRWNRLAGSERLTEVIEGIEFRDGIRQLKDAA